MRILSMMILLIGISAITISAQDKKPLSPHMTLESSFDGVDVKVEYNAPSMRNRTIMGDLVPYGKVWRTGANDATKITFSAPAMIEGQPIAAGTYSFFTIPNEDSWTIIFNKKANQWGSYSYSQAEDALRVDVSPQTLDAPVETMAIETMDEGIMLKWDTVGVPVKIGK